MYHTDSNSSCRPQMSMPQITNCGTSMSTSCESVSSDGATHTVASKPARHDVTTSILECELLANHRRWALVTVSKSGPRYSPAVGSGDEVERCEGRQSDFTFGYPQLCVTDDPCSDASSGIVAQDSESSFNCQHRLRARGKNRAHTRTHK